jgi:hypothetical protein
LGNKLHALICAIFSEPFFKLGLPDTISIEYDEQNAVKNGKTKIRNLFYCQNNSHYKQTVLYYILLIGHIESNPGPNIVSGKPNLKNGSLKIAHINAVDCIYHMTQEITINLK